MGRKLRIVPDVGTASAFKASACTTDLHLRTGFCKFTSFTESSGAEAASSDAVVWLREHLRNVLERKNDTDQQHLPHRHESS